MCYNYFMLIKKINLKQAHNLYSAHNFGRSAPLAPLCDRFGRRTVIIDVFLPTLSSCLRRTKAYVALQAFEHRFARFTLRLTAPHAP